MYRKIGATDATFYLDGIRIGAFREQGHHNDFDIELLALEGFNKAKAASYAEAARIGTSTICQPVLQIPKNRRSGTRSSSIPDAL